MSLHRRATRASRIMGYLWAIGVNFTLWYVFHNLHLWGLPFILARRLPSVLPAIDLALRAGVLANALLLPFDPPWFVHLAKAAVDLASLYAAYTAYRVFPFDFGSAEYNRAAHWLMVLGLIVAGLATMVKATDLAYALED